MNPFKKICFLLLALLSSNTVFSLNDDPFSNFEADMNAFDDFVINEVNNAATRLPDPNDIIQLLVQLGALEILQEDLYLKTYPLDKRNVLDLPIFLPHTHETRPRSFGAYLFYNETSRMNFSHNSTCISSYLGICEPTLLQKIKTSLERFPEFDFDPVALLPLFKGMTVQERKLGFMFYGAKRYKKIHFSILVPLMYLERNFFVTHEEQEEIERALDITPNEENDDSFVEQHFISDKCGIGDTRILLGFPVKKKNNLSVDIGVQITLPTAFAFKKGIKGSHFCRNAQRKQLNFEKLFDAADKKDIDMVNNMLSCFSISALDYAAANLIETKLGNEHHLGLGFFLTTKTPLSYFIRMPWARPIKMRGNLVLEILLPAIERRYFTEADNPDDFDPSKFDEEVLEDNPKLAQERLCFLETKLTDKFFPFSFNTSVHPGIVFRWTSIFSYDLNRWRFQIGSDWWFKGGESFGRIKKPRTFSGELLLDRAKRPFAFQSKFHGAIFYTKKKLHKTWTFSFFVDGTYWNYGLGEDFTVAFKAETNF